jgi:hypothetical protein
MIVMMTTLRKSVEIPANRRLYLDIPQDMPTGAAEVIIHALETKRPDDDFDEFFGCFKNHKLWKADSVKLVRKMRNEW